jgi:hypothetical protein
MGPQFSFKKQTGIHEFSMAVGGFEGFTGPGRISGLALQSVIWKQQKRRSS